MSAPVHLLLVEDRCALRTTLKRALLLYRYEVIAVDAGLAAQDCLTTCHVDILLADVSLPGAINGFELAAWARALRPRLPIVLISGLALYDPPADLAADPCVRMLPKPFTVAALVGALADLLSVT
jgi:CheY-like chemotaxis protein